MHIFQSTRDFPLQHTFKYFKYIGQIIDQKNTHLKAEMLIIASH